MLSHIAYYGTAQAMESCLSFSSVAMKEYEIIMAKRVRQLVGCLEDMIERSDEKANATVDMTLWLKYFRLGGGFELMKAGRDVDGFWTPLESSLCARKFCRERTLERLRMGANRKDLFYYLLSFHMEFLARWFHRTRRQSGEELPETEEYLRAEADGAIPSGEEPLDVTKLGQMEWLNGCTSTRLFGFNRQSQAGLTASWEKYSSGPAELPHTEAFLPERWVNTGSPAGEHNTAAFFPFSYGHANCAGKNLALLEMPMLLCWMIWRFRFSEAPGRQAIIRSLLVYDSSGMSSGEGYSRLVLSPGLTWSGRHRPGIYAQGISKASVLGDNHTRTSSGGEPARTLEHHALALYHFTCAWACSRVPAPPRELPCARYHLTHVLGAAVVKGQEAARDGLDRDDGGGGDYYVRDHMLDHMTLHCIRIGCAVSLAVTVEALTYPHVYGPILGPLHGLVLQYTSRSQFWRTSEGLDQNAAIARYLRTPQRLKHRNCQAPDEGFRYYHSFMHFLFLRVDDYFSA
ncbi:hypothetical protein EI94DRAFT_1702303 [Lactarius quietus]|nr:hypothetical protein EI94DRAFT_1702303 [Lactarius quietus]